MYDFLYSTTLKAAFDFSFYYCIFKLIVTDS